MVVVKIWCVRVDGFGFRFDCFIVGFDLLSLYVLWMEVVNQKKILFTNVKGKCVKRLAMPNE